MGFTINQSKKFTDTIRVISADPTRADLEFTYELEPEKMISSAQKGLAVLENVQNKLREHPDSDALAGMYGEAVISLFILFFGEENAKRIIEFYEERYADMLTDFIPAITDEIMPKLREASREKARRIKKAAGVSM